MTLFMFSLSISDLGCGCTFMLISAVLCQHGTSTEGGTLQYLAKVHFFFMTWFVSVSWFGLCGVTVSKTIAILKPLRYSQLLTANRCYAAITCSWVLCLLQAVCSTVVNDNITWNVDMCSYRLPIDKNYSAFFATLVVVGSASLFLLLGYSSVRIFIVVVRAHRQIAALAQSVGGATGRGSVGNMTRQSVRSARNIFIICVTSMTLASPLVFFSILRNVSNTYWISGWFSFVALSLFDCNTFMNSLLYIFLYRSVRRKTVEMLRDLYGNCRRQ